VPFTYLDKNASDESFFGKWEEPMDIEACELKREPDKGSLAEAISNSGFIERWFKKPPQESDERYSRAVGRIFLKPFGLFDPEKFFSLDQATVREILQYNTNAKLQERDFYTVKGIKGYDYRPYLLIDGTILTRRKGKAKLLNFFYPKPARYHFEMTPLYVGSGAFHPNAGPEGRPIGGGYIAPHLFDSEKPHHYDADKSLVTVSLRECDRILKFTFSDVIGTSRAAPAEIVWTWIGNFHFVADKLACFPEFKYWSPRSPQDFDVYEHDFDDCGLTDNLGIMALLRPKLRPKVKRIVVFCNSGTPIDKCNPFLGM